MNRAIKDFVVNILGCGCPDEVFSSIRMETSPGQVGGIQPGFIVRIGGRLMIVGVFCENVLPQEGPLADLVQAGMRTRDGEGFNRLRIVVVSDDPDMEAMLRPVYARIPERDDRVHLHVVKKGVIDKMLAGGSAGREGGEKMGEFITKPTVWHEMEGPFIGGREHYQEKSYGFEPLQEAEKEEEKPEPEEKR